MLQRWDGAVKRFRPTRPGLHAIWLFPAEFLTPAWALGPVRMAPTPACTPLPCQESPPAWVLWDKVPQEACPFLEAPEEAKEPLVT